jgi:hypothetical protein
LGEYGEFMGSMESRGVVDFIDVSCTVGTVCSFPLLKVVSLFIHEKIEKRYSAVNLSVISYIVLEP